jgi:hypothetical protein
MWRWVGCLSVEGGRDDLYSNTTRVSGRAPNEAMPGTLRALCRLTQAKWSFIAGNSCYLIG